LEEKERESSGDSDVTGVLELVGVEVVNHTELAIEPKDFAQYSLENVEEDIVVALKETKAICALPMPSISRLAFIFLQAGKPILFTLKYYTNFFGM